MRPVNKPICSVGVDVWTSLRGCFSNPAQGIGVDIADPDQPTQTDRQWCGGERCEELKLNAGRDRPGEAARGWNVEREKQMQILEKITLDDVRASWSAGYATSRSACSALRATALAGFHCKLRMLAAFGAGDDGGCGLWFRRVSLRGGICTGFN